MRTKTFGSPLLAVLAAACFVLPGCQDDPVPGPDTVIYKTDGRSLRYGDPLPIALDLSEDGQVDFTIFLELTANSQGDRLYAGVNPIGASLIKSGPAIAENFLSMGHLVRETPGAVIDSDPGVDRRWTGDHSALAIKNTLTGGGNTYEGEWDDDAAGIVGIQNAVGGSYYFGWLRIHFDREAERITLIDFAYDTTAGRPIRAGMTMW